MLYYLAVAALLIQILSAVFRLQQNRSFARCLKFKADYSSSRACAADFVRLGCGSKEMPQAWTLALGECNAFDPKSGGLELRPEIYFSNSLGSLALAAHEVGHAIDGPGRYSGSIALLSDLLQLAANLCLLTGLLAPQEAMLELGLFFFFLSLLLRLPLLVEEFRATRKARQLLQQSKMFSARELSQLERSLRGMFLTYLLP